MLSYICGSLYSQIKLLKPNVCILYTENMNYYCIFKPGEISCNKMISRKYFGEKVIKVWFYYGKYCREFGFKSYLK